MSESDFFQDKLGTNQENQTRNLRRTLILERTEAEDAEGVEEDEEEGDEDEKNDEERGDDRDENENEDGDGESDDTIVITSTDDEEEDDLKNMEVMTISDESEKE